MNCFSFNHERKNNFDFISQLCRVFTFYLCLWLYRSLVLSVFISPSILLSKIYSEFPPYWLIRLIDRLSNHLLGHNSWEILLPLLVHATSNKTKNRHNNWNVINWFENCVFIEIWFPCFVEWLKKKNYNCRLLLLIDFHLVRQFKSVWCTLLMWSQWVFPVFLDSKYQRKMSALGA